MASNTQTKRPKTPKEDFYHVLGVERTATDEEIKRAYRRLALQYHPDKNPDPSATARFQAINKAYKVLGDPKLRSTYDLLGPQAANLIDDYQDPEAYSQLSPCKKFLYGLICCLSGGGCCCCCCLCFCGCFCCCNFCCGRCCGLFKRSTVGAESMEDPYDQTTSSVHQQPTDSNRY